MIRQGRDLFFWKVVYTQDDKPIGKGLLIYRAPDYAGQPRRCLASQVSLRAFPSSETSAVNSYGIYAKTQITTVYEGPGRIRLAMPCTADVVDERGQLHEGAIASLLDIAGTAASWPCCCTCQGRVAPPLGCS